MLHLQTILPDTLELLKMLSAQPEMQGMRLVGGTSLALQYGHRQSVDLDFFGTPAVSQDGFGVTQRHRRHENQRHRRTWQPQGLY